MPQHLWKAINVTMPLNALMVSEGRGLALLSLLPRNGPDHATDMVIAVMTPFPVVD